MQAAAPDNRRHTTLPARSRMTLCYLLTSQKHAKVWLVNVGVLYPQYRFPCCLPSYAWEHWYWRIGLYDLRGRRIGSLLSNDCCYWVPPKEPCQAC